MVLVENSWRWAVDSHNGISEGALGRPRSARQLHVCRLPLGGVCAPWWKIVLTLLTTCQHTREAASVCVCLCVCTHVNDHLSRLERIMRPEEPLQQGSAPSSFCSCSASLSRLAEVRWPRVFTSISAGFPSACRSVTPGFGTASHLIFIVCCFTVGDAASCLNVSISLRKVLICKQLFTRLASGWFLLLTCLSPQTRNTPRFLRPWLLWDGTVSHSDCSTAVLMFLNEGFVVFGPYVLTE